MTDLYKNLLSFKGAKKVMLNSLRKNKTETIDIEDSEDRVLASEIYSKINIPEFDNSAVDGFGFINSKKIVRELKIIGESKHGKPCLGKINNNGAVKVYKGDNVWKELTKVNTVCMEED